VEIETAVLQRKTLSPGFSCDGPVIIEEDLSTTLIPPGFRGEVLEQGALEIREKG
jgi:N-methylhydantoinase A/oxoprolinase/acetone carboxylase beta subunit